MGDIAIRVDGLGKKYYLGSKKERYKTLRDTLSGFRASSLRGLFRRASRSESKPPFWALKDVSFEVERGEVVGIIGRNGAGKSTLLKVLSRITEPTEGSVDLHGRVGSLLEVGTGFHPELTGRENIHLNGAILGMRRAEIVRKFDDIVAFAEVEKFIDTSVKFYSSGMYTRLAFAVAAHLEPEILVVDEVLAVGDAHFQKKCLGKMGEVAKGGRTVLFVSHNMPSVRALCTSGLLLHRGEVRYRGAISDALEAYAREMAEADMGATVEWLDPEVAPGPPAVKLASVSVQTDGRVATSAVEFSAPLVIAVRYRLTRAMKGVRVGILVKDAYGTEVFGSSDYTEQTSTVREAGTYVVECAVPGHTLNSGRYFITLGADLCPGNEMLWFLNDCVHFEIEDHTGHGPNNDRPPGVARPDLHWTQRREA